MASIRLLSTALLLSVSTAFPHFLQDFAKREATLGSTLGSVVGGLTNVVFGTSNGPNPEDYPWQAPTATDSRSPCPAINTFANHGYLPRSGTNITLQTMTNALQAVVNFSPTFASSFASNAYSAVGIPTGGVLDLGNLTGTGLNHPAAMFHSDSIVKKGGDTSVNVTMVGQMLNDTAPPFPPPAAGYLDATTLAATHVRRLYETGQGGLVANLDLPDEPKEVAECALLLMGLGQVGPDGNVTNVVTRRFPKAWANEWLVLNRIPTDFVRPTLGWHQTDFLALTGVVEANAQTVNGAKQVKLGGA